MAAEANLSITGPARGKSPPSNRRAMSAGTKLTSSSIEMDMGRSEPRVVEKGEFFADIFARDDGL